MNFAGFFPQIVAGPIERRDDLLPQMEAFRFTWSPENLDEGVSWIALGFFFKTVLADNLALVFNASSTSNPYLVWIANVVFGLRIYYDFSGYSLIALGIARCLGIRLTLNFASPYCSTSSTEFWRRWHITLSHWFRDYLYIPLGGGRVKWWAFNIILVFTVSGIWHGAGWGFALWGLMHGAFLMINRLFSRSFVLSRPVAWGITMMTSFFAWLCFYESHPAVLFHKIKTIFTLSAYNLSSLRSVPGQWSPPELSLLCSFIFLTGIVLVMEWLSVTRYDEPYSLLRRPKVLAFLVILTVLLAPGTNNGFIYFAF